LDARTRVETDQQLEKFKGANELFRMDMTINTRNMKELDN